MSSIFAAYTSDPFSESWALEGKDGLARQLFRASTFIRGLRVQMRFGELSRAPLRLVRLQMLDRIAECDWLVRSPDRWDADLSLKIQQKHATLQSLRDSIDVRALLFDLMPQLEMAYLRAYRGSLDGERELIIEGCAHRNDHAARNVHSLVMRAKILGFNFEIKRNALQRISPSQFDNTHRPMADIHSDCD